MPNEIIWPLLNKERPLNIVALAFRATILEAVHKMGWVAKREKMERIIRSLLKSFSVTVVERDRKENTDSKTRSL